MYQLPETLSVEAVLFALDGGVPVRLTAMTSR
jgi:hypothetical protein